MGLPGVFFRVKILVRIAFHKIGICGTKRERIALPEGYRWNIASTMQFWLIPQGIALFALFREAAGKRYFRSV
jgi:hypothetical protein